ncbi:MAG: CARDB domain-containing protein [Thermoplasmatota archaeon]
MTGKSWKSWALLFCITALVSPCASPLPAPDSGSGRGGEDLTVMEGSYNITPYPPRLYDVLTVNFTIVNQGTENVTSPFVVAFFLNNTTTPLDRSSRVRVERLDVGETANVSCIWDTRTSEFSVFFSGVEYGIIVVVDYLENISESDEGNNNMTVMQALGPERLPNLVLEGFTVEPRSPVKGDEALVNVSLTNTGEIEARFFKVYCFDGDISQTIASRDISLLNVSESATTTLIWNTSGCSVGAHTLIVYVNPEFYYTRIQELDWSDNNGTMAVVIQPPEFRLELVSLELVPPAPHRGDPLVVNLTLRNNSTRPAEEAPVALSIDGDELYNATHNLSAGEELPLSLELDTSLHAEGQHTLRVLAGNINASYPLTILPMRRADLLITNVSFLPIAPIIGQSVVVMAGVANAGDSASQPCELSLSLDYDFTPVASSPVPSLQPDEVREIILSWNTSGVSEGSHKLRLTVDSGSVVAEHNESNNYLVWAMDFEGEMDIGLEGLSIHPASPVVGERVQFSVSVVNPGSLRCPSATLSLRVGGLEVDSRNVLPLAPAGYQNHTLVWATEGLAPGVYEYEVRVEPGENATDAAPLDNVINGSLELQPPPGGPDLVVREISHRPDPPRIGSLLELMVSVENIGTGDAGPSSLMVLFESGSGVLRFTDSAVAVPAVPAGEAVVVNITGDTSRFRAGVYIVNVTVDYNNYVGELNESNNYLARELELLEPVPKAPALRVDEVFFEGRLEEGALVSVIARVSNSGDGEARHVIARLVVDGKEVANASVEQLAPGANRTVSLPWRPSAGSHSVVVKVEAEGASPVLSATKRVSVAALHAELSPYLVAAVVVVVVLVLAVVAVRSLVPGHRERPKVRLVDEEE